MELALKPADRALANARWGIDGEVAHVEQHEIQEKIRKLERKQRRPRQEIFKAKDEIIEKHGQLIDSLERRLAQRTETETFFAIRWAVR